MNDPMQEWEAAYDREWQAWCDRANAVELGISRGPAGRVLVDRAAMPRILDALERAAKADERKTDG